MAVARFQTIESMAQHQATREVAEALRVRDLPDAAFSEWLKASLDPLQALARLPLDAEKDGWAASARCFHSAADKQHFEDARELARAVQLALSRQAHEQQ